MFKASRAALVLGLMLFSVSLGCGTSASSRLIGKWELDAQKLEESAAAAAKGNPFAGMVTGMLT